MAKTNKMDTKEKIILLYLLLWDINAFYKTPPKRRGGLLKYRTDKRALFALELLSNLKKSHHDTFSLIEKYSKPQESEFQIALDFDSFIFSTMENIALYLSGGWIGKVVKGGPYFEDGDFEKLEEVFCLSFTLHDKSEAFQNACEEYLLADFPFIK